MTMGDDRGTTTVDENEPRGFGTGVRRRARPRRRRGRVTVVVLVLILVPLLAFGSGIGWFWYQLGGASSGDKVQVRLERGWGVTEVADELAAKDVVRSALEHTQPEIAADVIDVGIMMTGGGSLLREISTVLEYETGLPVTVALIFASLRSSRTRSRTCPRYSSRAGARSATRCTISS